MARVELLSENVINQVAAGEVIERPASVLKELVENSLDAGARRISVAFRHAGKDFLSVEDDGAGMDESDALLALQRHATSKIRCLDDLFALHSFGFRGEALASIASISRFLLKTRSTRSELGFEVVLDGGNLIKKGPCVCSVGTRIEVSQLFKTVPVRRKFLKSDQTETNHLLAVIRRFGLAFPDREWLLSRDGSPHFHWRADSLANRLRHIFDENYYQRLMPIRLAEGPLSIEGFCWKPTRNWPGSVHNDFFFFVNLRFALSPLVREVIAQVYESVLNVRVVPAGVYFLSLPPDQVDVNVHPTKREVRFRREAEVKDFLRRALSEALLAFLQNEKFQFFSQSAADEKSASPLLERLEKEVFPEEMIPALHFPSRSDSLEDRKIFEDATDAEFPKKEIDLPSNKKIVAAKVGGDSPVVSQRMPPQVTVPQGVSSESLALSRRSDGSFSWRWIGKYSKRCALFASETGLLFVDLYRASVRVEYERILKDLNDAPRQKLLFPILLNFQAQSLEVTNEMMAELETLGFELEVFGERIYRVNALPNWLQESSGEAFLYDWLVLKRRKSTEIQTDYLAQIAADYISDSRNFVGESEAMALMNCLLHCSNPQRTPTGQRIYFEFSRGEMDRRFQ